MYVKVDYCNDVTIIVCCMSSYVSHDLAVEFTWGTINLQSLLWTVTLLLRENW